MHQDCFCYFVWLFLMLVSLIQSFLIFCICHSPQMLQMNMRVSLQRVLIYCHWSVLVSISYLLLLLSMCLWHWLGSFCMLGNKTPQSLLGNLATSVNLCFQGKYTGKVLNVFQRETYKLFSQQRRERLRHCLCSQFGTKKVRKKRRIEVKWLA